MFTASYRSFKGAGRISISRGFPRGVPAGYRRYAPLAPGEWLWNTEDEATYRDLYFAQLSKLDLTRVIADLHKLAGDCAVPTLLCFCDLRKTGAWCHRTMVAEWVENGTGEVIVELSPRQVRKMRTIEQLNLEF